ncbi:MAG: AMP-dependent synthetase/ligase [Solirubrobacteraceae bacterium]|nr:MAG: long-chain fatty acid--CoA ligase [Solirubrobacterales bacterium]
MEATTAAGADVGSGSKTIADLILRASERYSERPAIRYKRDGSWEDVSYPGLAKVVRELALGLLAVGIEAGDRVCILANTRPQWSYADFAITSAGGVVVPIYQTNSPDECAWVAGNSGARAVVCEDASQLAKIVAVRDRLPELRTLIVMDPGEDTSEAISLDDLQRRGREAGLEDELGARIAGVGPGDPYTFIYTSGTTGPPKGCVLTHGNYRETLNMCEGIGVVRGEETTYLYLPLAHSFALLIQLLTFDMGGVLAYWGGDAKQIVPELTEVKPGYFPSVPRIFEKIYTLATSAVPAEERERFDQAIELGFDVRRRQAKGEPVPEEIQRSFEEADERIFAKVRGLFGGNVRQAVTGAAPIAPEILRFFYACGVPVLEGFGMTETSTVSTYSTPENFKFGTVGRALPGVEIKIADDGEVLLKGANIFQGYYGDAEKTFGTIEDGWLHTGDLGSLDEDGYLSITGRKKDIIITAGGKNLTPANIENDMKQSRWVSQAVMYGDRRPYPVMLITLDEEEIVPWAQERDKPTEIAALRNDPDVRALIQAELDRANANYAQVEQVKKLAILDHDLSQETGELTPTLKVKRNVVNEKYSELFDALYGS